ncbi:MAG: hypothetical protein M3347_17155 [Armatimonadota bacterium]|nr:hypothetical protein [Armatimonadota bacterium]
MRSSLWLLFVQIGFAGFLLSLFGLVWRGFGRDGKARRGSILWLLASALFFILWLVSLPRVERP